MRIAIDGVVGAHDGIAAAEQRNACRNPETQSLQRGKLGFRMPELRGRADGIGTLACAVPEIATPAAERLDQSVAGMGMAVDEARHDRHAARVDDLARLMVPRHFIRRTDGDDAVALDRHRPIGNDPPLGVDGDDGAVSNQDICFHVSNARCYRLVGKYTIERRRQAQKLARIRKLRGRKLRFRVRHFNALPHLHDGNTVAHLSYHRQIVADGQDRRPEGGRDRRRRDQPANLAMRPPSICQLARRSRTTPHRKSEEAQFAISCGNR
jgi:hypothetical protein